jgi:hypothetical protein
MIYINSANGVCYGDDDFDVISTFLASCYGFGLIDARSALEIINRFDRIV